MFAVTTRLPAPSAAAISVRAGSSPPISSTTTSTPGDATRWAGASVSSVAGIPALVARTGYTGEDGFEVAVPADAAADLWDRYKRGERNVFTRSNGRASRSASTATGRNTQVGAPSETGKGSFKWASPPGTNRRANLSPTWNVA